MSASLELRRVLVPLDGSVLAEAILPVAEALARGLGAELLLLRVVEGQRAREPGLEAERDAQHYLEATCERLRGRGLRHLRPVLWHGEPGQAIANAAAREGAQLVAMGTHGRSGLERLRLGSVAGAVVQRAPVPVVLVRGVAGWGTAGVGRVLVPVDGSLLSEAVLPVVAALAGPLDATVDLLHVVEPFVGDVEASAYVPPPVPVPDPETYLAGLAGPLERRGLRVTSIVRTGPPPDVIPAVLAETGAGLVAMSTHGRTGLGRLLLGSVAERVLRTVPVPVLLWKPPAEPRQPGAPSR